MSESARQAARTVEVSNADLPLHCPMPGDAVWCSHPRVYLPVAEKGTAQCPYCGTLYTLKGWNGQSGHSHH